MTAVRIPMTHSVTLKHTQPLAMRGGGMAAQMIYRVGIGVEAGVR